MNEEKQSFFEKLTGTVSEDETAVEHPMHAADAPAEPAEEDEGETGASNAADEISENKQEGHLTVDVYQTPTHVVVQAPMAGVKPDDVDVSINNDMITIRGRRSQKKETNEDTYYYREVFWGPFSRSVLMPDEVDSDQTEASFKNGLLTVKMPKVNKEGVRQVKIQAKEI